MRAFYVVKTWDRDPKKLSRTGIRQTYRFGRGKVHDESDCPPVRRFNPKNTNAPRLDHPFDLGGRLGDQGRTCACQNGPVVRNQPGTERQQLKRKRRFAAAGRSNDKRRAVFNADRRAVDDLGICPVRHGGSGRQAHNETGTQRLGRDVHLGWTNVLCPDHAPVGLDDLF